MGGRVKKIDLKTVPGAADNRIKWLMASGVGTTAEARALANVFISEFQNVKDEIKSGPRKKRKGKI